MSTIYSNLRRQSIMLVTGVIIIFLFIGIIILVPLVLRYAADKETATVADANALAEANMMSDYIAKNIVNKGQAPVQNYASIKKWLDNPLGDYAQYYQKPTTRILSEKSGTLNIAVFSYGKVSGFGNDKAWGVACAQYRMNASNMLKTQTIACPKNLSRNPS